MRFIVLFALCLIAFDNGYCTNVTVSDEAGGFWYELLMAKLECLEQEFKTENKKQAKMLQQVLKQTSEISQQQKYFFKNDIFTIASCIDEKANKSGRYKLKVSNTTIEVYCEQQLYGTGWLLIQNRYDGSVRFDRNWTDYRNGFGDLEGEFWLGLEIIHMKAAEIYAKLQSSKQFPNLSELQLTSSKKYELLVHLEDFGGNVKHITYEEFSIGNEVDKYTLHISKNFTGTLGDSLGEYHDGKQFSTIDQDNDLHDVQHCALSFRAGWWFNKCYFSNLNGLYYGDKGMVWYKFNNDYSKMKISKMMIREK